MTTASVAGPTPSQTVGPFFRFGLDRLATGRLVEPGSAGARRLHGRVLDGAGDPVPDAVVEIWQADASGRFSRATSAWRGWGRCLTDDAGGWQVTTVKPGRVDDRQAPHVDLTLFARGLLQRLVSRIYFPDEVAANEVDPVLLAAGSRRATLIATEEADGGLGHDLVLQGEGETVFFVF